jgi:hypothetical protein
MNHVYCTECGSKMEYSYSKPKFCSNCGNKCGSDSQSLNKSSLNESNSSESLSDDETSVNEVPDISKLDVDYESHGNHVFSFESLVEGKADSKPARKRNINLDDFIDGRRR